jgi:CMP-N,N'-diacetyllegionaminic acid synthase
MRLAIIPARGGSRGVPGKNLMSIAGRHLLGHAIQCAQDAECDRVIVSTDCPKIRQESAKRGAYVVTRPEELAGDTSSSQDALRHALQGVQCDAVAFIQCTTPMLVPGDIRGCFEKLPGFDIVVCCHRFDGIVLDGSGRLLNMPAGGSQRRQDRDHWIMGGGCWAFQPDYLNGEWMAGRIGIHEAAFPHRLEIDTQEDVWLTEAILENLLHRHGQHDLSDGRNRLRQRVSVA